MAFAPPIGVGNGATHGLNKTITARRVATAAAALVFALGVLILLGWTFRAEAVVRPPFELPPVKPLTALAFTLAGASLWLQLDGAGKQRMRAGRMAGAATAAIGALALVEYAIGIDVGFDGLLFGGQLDALGDDLGGRPAPQTSMALVAAGSALCMLDARTHDDDRYRPAGLLALAAGAVACIVLLGYAFTADDLYRVSRSTGMSIIAAIALVALSAGTIAARPSKPPLSLLTGARPSTLLARRLLPAILIAPPLAGAAVVAADRADLIDGSIALAIATLAVCAALVATVLVAGRAADAAADTRDELQRELLATRVALRERERLNTEEALAEAERRFRVTFETAPTGMALVAIGDAAGRFLQVNPALCRMTGHDEPQLLATGLAALTHPDERGEVRAELRHLITGAIGNYRGEHRFVRRSGSTCWVAIGASLVRDGGGRPLYGVVQIEDVEERLRFEEHLRHQAEHDTLTGLLNRRSFGDELARIVDSGTTGECGAVLLIDIDHFKDVNDTLGHVAGDSLLCRVAELLREGRRATDAIARIGGDEFAMILPGASRDAAERVAADVRERIREHVGSAGSGRRLHITASIGIATYGDDDAYRPSAVVLADADLAMSDAKQAGRDRVATHASPEHRLQVEKRISWLERIRVALETDGLFLERQPILEIGSGRVTSHELLVRMRSSDGERHPPGAFLHLAERFGLIREVDRWVLTEAIKVLAEGGTDRYHVNLSAESITDPSLPLYIRARVRDAGVDPSRLVLEITETSAISSMDEARTFAAGIKALGCHLALDDFGAGFGSFYYLKHLPVDYLKIDGEFIRHLTTDPVNRVVVESLVQAGSRLGKRLIAEFVEDAETLELLEELGMDMAQGYHIGRPGPLARRRRARTARAG